MSKFFRQLFFLSFFFSIYSASSQVPTCPSPYVYMDGGPFIKFYNPALPLSATNPSNTNIPTFGSGLALMPNINGGLPSPTFYTTSGGNYYWWNGTSWVNTGHSTGNGAAVNIGGCGGKIYNLVGGTGQVYVYNGTGPGTLLTTIVGFNGGGPYDIVCDCNCNFYMLNTTTPNQSLTMYSPTGATLCTYSLTGMPNTTAGGGFAIIGNMIYVKNNLTNGFFIGTMVGTTITFTQVTGFTASPGDFASCPVCNTLPGTAATTGTLGCNVSTVNIVATTTVTPVTYTWTGPGLVGAINASVAVANAPGVYTCTISAGGCPPTQTVVTTTVTSNGTILTITLTPTGTITCANPNVQITANPGPAGYTYTWTGPGIIGANNGQSVTVGTAGTYTAAVSQTSTGCTGTQTVTIVSNTTVPIVTSTPSNTTICAGSTAGFTAGGAVTYTWNTGATTTNITVTPPTTTSYTVVGTAANGCTNSAVSIASVIALPVPIINSNSPICVGGTLTLNVNGGTTYSWTGPNNFNSVLPNPTIPNVTALANGIYTVIATSGICTGSITANIVINPLPIPVALSNAPVCEGQPINFTGSGGIIYSWSGPSFNSNAQNPGILVAGLPNNGLFTLTVTDANGCINSTNLNVVVNALPVIGVVGSTVCAQQAINLGANGGTTYLWSGPGGYTSNQQNPNIPNSNPGMAGVYNVTVTNANGCMNTNFTNVIVNPLPTPNAFNNGPLCVNQLLNLSANGGLTYTWNGPGGFFATGQSPTVTANNANMSGNYTVTVSDNIGCTGTAVTLLNVNPLPNVSIIANTSKGCVPLCLTFTCATSPSATVNWSFGDGSGSGGINSSNCYKVAHDYTVTAGVTDANGCFNQNTYPLSAYPNPIADFNFAPIRPIENLDDVVFTDASYAAEIATWNWYFANNATYQSNLQNPQFIYPEAGTYPVVLVVKSDKGCLDTVIKVIIVGEDYGIYVPNAFTPNGDGVNDVFQPKGYGITKYDFGIFDRWGEQIFQTNNFEHGWDGTIKGITAKNDVYSWRIKLTNVFGKSHELTGHVTLIK